MKQKAIFILLVMLCLTTSLLAQKKATISGYIKDAETGEALIGATIFVKDKTIGIISNSYGFYSLTLPHGKYSLCYSFIGYKTIIKDVEIKGDITLSIDISPDTKSLEEIVVSDKRMDENIKSTNMGMVKLNPKDIKSIAVVFGEQDILKTIQLLPGIKPSSEGSTGFHVRGGGADQNLILLDEAPVYNSGHLLGFFSVFNSDAINDFTLYKGNAPAKYGGRLSSVLDVRMKEGNSKKATVSGGLGLISSRLTVEAPILSDKASFMMSGRRTYADLFLKLSDNKTLKDTKLYFYDFNTKLNYRINENNRLFLSGYFGQDVCRMVQINNSGARMNFGNATASARWNHIFPGKRLFLNSTLIYSKYEYSIGVGTKNISSTIEDYNIKEDFSFFISPNHSIKFGANVIHHTFRPGEITTEGTSGKNSDYENKYAYESGAYLSHEAKLGNRFSLDYGLRFSMFSFVGPGTIYNYSENGEIISQKTYKSGELIQNYSGIEPRISSNIVLNETSSVKASYSRNQQFIHLVSNSTSSSNFEIWQPSTNNVKPEIADQFAIGYFKNLDESKYELSLETYYKDFRNLIEYRDGANVLFSSNVEAEYVYGNGQAYGLELYLRKKTGRLTGWVSYTLGRTDRTFEKINNGKKFPARYDRTHDFSITGIYKLTNRLSLSGTWIYYTGNAVTYPSAKYNIEQFAVPLYSKRNAHRMPDYHRLDLSLTLDGRKRKRYESSWNFCIYNAYARLNPYAIEFRQDENDSQRTKAIQLARFTIVPSITYNFKF